MNNECFSWAIFPRWPSSLLLCHLPPDHLHLRGEGLFLFLGHSALLIQATCCSHTFRGWLLSRSPPRGSPALPGTVTSHLTQFYFLTAFTILCSDLILHVCLLAFRLQTMMQSRGLSHPVSNTKLTVVQYLLYKLLQGTGCVDGSRGEEHSPPWCINSPLQPCSTFFKEVGKNYKLHFFNTGKLQRFLLIIRFLLIYVFKIN